MKGRPMEHKSRTNRRILAAGLLALALVLIVVFVTRRKEAAGPPEDQCRVRIAAVPAAFYLPLFVAHDQGFLSAAGCSSEVILFNSVNDQMTALLHGDAEVSGLGSGGAFALEAESPGRVRFVYGQNNRSYSFLVPPDWAGEGLEAFQGKRIGTWPSPTPRVFLHLMLDSVVGSDGFEIVPVEFRFLTQALVSGDVDALFNTDVFTQQAIEGGHAKFFSATPLEEYVMKPFFNGGGLVQRSLKDDKPAEWAAIRTAIPKAVDFIREQPAAARQSLVTHIGVSEDVALEAPTDEFVRLDELEPEKVQAVADILVREGVVSTQVDAAQMIRELGDG